MEKPKQDGIRIYVEKSKQDGIMIYVEKSKLNWDLKEKGVAMYVYVYIRITRIIRYIAYCYMCFYLFICYNYV